MIKDFLIKKENIFIFIIALISIFFIILGFLFLFFKDDSSQNGPRVIPNTIDDIVWGEFQSNLFKNKIKYPEYMFMSEQKEESGVGITMAEFKPREFLTYFSNQNHVSIYPSGIDNQLFYGKTKQTKYTSTKGQVFNRTEYVTTDNKVWGVLLVPEKTPQSWQPRGFIWIQSGLKNKEMFCLSSKGILISNVICDPYAGQQPVYKGDVSEEFIRFGYEIINKNSF